MTLQELQLECGWSKNEMARQAGLDFNTLNRAMSGKPVSIATADKIVRAIGKRLERTIRIQDVDGLKIVSR